MVLIGMVADHEVVAADRLKPVAVVEPPRAMIVDIHREVELLEALPPSLVDRPVAERGRDPAPARAAAASSGKLIMMSAAVNWSPANHSDRASSASQ